MKALRYAVVLAVVASLSGTVFAAEKKAMSVQPFPDVKFFPMDPKHPDGGQMAVANGDPMKGESVIYLKLKKGSAGLHSHSSDYHAVLVSGTARHWDAKDSGQGKELTAGSYWFQPGKVDHGDECLSDECLVVLHVLGKFDFMPAKAAAPAPKK